MGDVMDSEERQRGLLDAVVGIAADLDLDSVLRRIVRAACQLSGAQYGALGVLGSGPDRRLQAFVTHGLTDEDRAKIGDLPRGHGILGLIIDSPDSLRLDNLGDHRKSFGFPPNHPPMGTFLGVPIRTRDTVFGNLYLTEKQSPGGFTVDDEQIVVALAAAAGVVIENARLYDQSARRQRWLEAAAEVTAAMLGDAPCDDGLQLVTDRARLLADADLAALLLRHGGGRLLVEATSGPVLDTVVGTGVPTGGTVAGAVLDSGEVAVLDDATADERLQALGFTAAAGWPELGSLVLLPLSSAGPVAGLLVIGWSPERTDAFRETDPVLAGVFAAQAALALQVAQGREDRDRLAVFEDRDRIGRDLHDLVIQRLFAVGLTLENAVRLTDQPEVTTRISGAVDDIDGTIKDIRRTIFELSAPPTSTDLRSEIGEAVAVMVPALGFTPRLRTEGPVDSAVNADLHAHLLAVVRELVSNVARHAHATLADVRLEVGDEVVLTVVDDGVGIEDGGRHSGLTNMAERATSLGGTFVVRRAGHDGGTVAVWRVPAG
ncbi:MAG: GAF domain-containing protein [Actinomycetia bacterium]|nr:GAF domain-containing protein [Actinomycetes bacterium]